MDLPLRNSSWLVDQLCDPAGDRWPLSDAGRQWGGPEGLGVSSGSGFVGWGPGCQGAVQRGAAAALPLQWCRLSLPPLNFVSQAQVGPGRRDAQSNQWLFFSHSKKKKAKVCKKLQSLCDMPILTTSPTPSAPRLSPQPHWPLCNSLNHLINAKHPGTSMELEHDQCSECHSKQQTISAFSAVPAQDHEHVRCLVQVSGKC